MYGVNKDGETYGQEGDAKLAATKRITELKAQSWALIVEAMKIADEHEIYFIYEPENVGDYTGEINGGHWYPSAWSASSLGC